MRIACDLRVSDPGTKLAARLCPAAGRGQPFCPVSAYAEAMTNQSLGGTESGQQDIPEIDTSVPHSARVYDYFLGGTDNFEADRIAAEAARPPGRWTSASQRPSCCSASCTALGIRTTRMAWSAG